jgi:hypothetical protein
LGNDVRAIVTTGQMRFGYRFGFNGMEKDNEVSGEGNSYTAEFWQYDSRLGRRFNVDPIFKEYESPYACFGNSPIIVIDPNGADSTFSNIDGSTFNIITSDNSWNGIYDEKGDVNSQGGVWKTTDYTGVGALEYADELMAGGEKATSSLKGYLTFTYGTSKEGLQRFYLKPDARGLNNLKGIAVKASGAASTLKVLGPLVTTALEVPEIVYGYKESTQEGNKQIAGTVGSVGGGTLGGIVAGMLLGATQLELGPFVIIPIAVGAGIGGHLGEEGVEELYDQLVNPSENSRSKQIETLKYNPYLIIGPKY